MQSEVERQALDMTCALNYQDGRIAVLRQKKGLSQDEAARLAGIAPRTWRKLEEGGAKTCRISTFIDVCEAFNCSLDWLFVGHADMQKAVARAIAGYPVAG